MTSGFPLVAGTDALRFGAARQQPEEMFDRGRDLL